MVGVRRFSLTKTYTDATHVAEPFVRLPRPSQAGTRHDIARAHARLWLGNHRSDPDDFTLKTTSLLGMQIQFFNWTVLHQLFDEIFVRSCYAFEPPRDELTVIDAGGNIGLAAIWFARAFPKARITSIEPDPSTFAVLKQNVERNVPGRVRPIAAALGAEPGTITLVIDPQRPGDPRMSTTENRLSGKPVTVDAIRLSDLVDGPVDLLKLDVEGAEHDVLGEMAESGALAQVGAITMEYHHHIEPDVERFSELLALLKVNGFRYRVEARPAPGPLSMRSVSAFQDIALLAIRA